METAQLEFRETHRRHQNPKTASVKSQSTIIKMIWCQTKIIANLFLSKIEQKFIIAFKDISFRIQNMAKR